MPPDVGGFKRTDFQIIFLLKLIVHSQNQDLLPGRGVPPLVHTNAGWTFLDPKGAICGGDLCKVFIYSDRVPPYAQLGCARQTFLVVILGVTLMCLRHMFLLLWVMFYAGSQSAPIYCRSSKIPANKNPYENV